MAAVVNVAGGERSAVHIQMERPERMWFDLAVICDLREWLEERLGPLAKDEVLVEHKTNDAVVGLSTTPSFF